MAETSVASTWTPGPHLLLDKEIYEQELPALTSKQLHLEEEALFYDSLQSSKSPWLLFFLTYALCARLPGSNLST